MILSIIIPVYNVEKYLQKCIDSCLDQDISAEEYEIICINDGSPDGCDKILEDYELKYSNLRVITQANQGLSVARNKGLSCARGRYVWFVDSDDWIEPKAINIIRQAILHEERKGKLVDVIQIGYRYVYENSNTTINKVLSYWNNGISGVEYMSLPIVPIAAQFNVYRRSLLLNNNLWFKPGILHEDVEFKPRVLHYCNNCLCIREMLYNYLQRSTGSIMNSFKLKNGLDLIIGMSSLYGFVKEKKIDGKELGFFGNRISISINTLIKGGKSLSKTERKLLVSYLLEHREIFDLMTVSSQISFKLEGIIFRLFPSIALKLLMI